MDSSDRTLVAAGIAKRYGSGFALAGAHLVVAVGEVVALIGPNGSGKTTLLDALAGLLPVDAGTISAAGRRIARGHRPEALFYLPDGIRPWPDQRVDWVLRMGESMFGGSPRRRENLVDRLGVGSLLRSRMGTLSKGEHRRVMLAFALNTPQPFLLLDEPFDGLDLRQTREVMDLLRDHAREADGRGILVSIHQLPDAARVADRLVLLDRGQVVGAGSLEELRVRSGMPTASLEEMFLALT